MTESERVGVASLLPDYPDYEAEYWEGLQNGVLMIQKCPHCGNVQFPPSSICNNCLSEEIEWVPCSGKATLWSKVRFHKGYLKPYMDGPYSVGLVKLEEGQIVTTRLAEEYKDMEIGSPVKLAFIKTADGTVVAAAEPADE